jgi:hypothetical protein
MYLLEQGVEVLAPDALEEVLAQDALEEVLAPDALEEVLAPDAEHMFLLEALVPDAQEDHL